MSALARRAFAVGVTSMSLVACSAIWGFDDLRLGAQVGDGGGSDGGELPNSDAVGNKTANKVDILFVVDNAASMAPKLLGLGRSVDELIRAAAATNDVHVGVISSSLGSVGGDICREGILSQRGHLIGGRFLDYAAASSVDTYTANVRIRIADAGNEGCPYRQPLESLYHFLAAPDPWLSVDTALGEKASYVDTDDTVLTQRAEFLRPDSLLVIVMLTDAEDASLDPLSFGGFGWGFSSSKFPGSNVKRADESSTTAPRATSVCATNPADPGCTSCKCIDEPCPPVASDPSCMRDGGYYGGEEDRLNTRFHKMKQRYGRDPQFPVSRYVNALTKVRVPRRADEHQETSTDGKRRIADYAANAATCTNPIFAAKLPTSSSEESCALPVGQRDKELVLFGVLGGVPRSLIGADGKPTSWTNVLGSDPAGYSDDGKDEHMIQSILPRDGLPPASTQRGNNGTDPDHGREWDTGADDLQYACTAAIVPAVTCNAAQASCDCATVRNPPLCGSTSGVQTRTKAYPSLRQLRVARDLGDRAVVGSVCRTADETYASTLDLLATRITARIAK